MVIKKKGKRGETMKWCVENVVLVGIPHHN